MCLKYAVHPFLCISICCSSRDLMNIRLVHTQIHTYTRQNVRCVCVCVQFGRNWTKIQFHARICVCSANAFHMQLLLLVGIAYEMFVCVCVCVSFYFMHCAQCTFHLNAFFLRITRICWSLLQNLPQTKCLKNRNEV